jgi:GT2 family glycosyltransferase
VNFTAIVVTHANEQGVRKMLGNLIYQTRQPDEIIVVCTETPGAVVARLREDFPGVRFETIDEVGDWGHAKRAHGLALATGDWLGFFNDDDSYEADYLETMLDEAEADDVDVVWCAWNEQPRCAFRKYESTAGNFVVRASLAKQVGWTERCYEADGIFIDGLVAAGARTTKIEETLYHHNVQ